MEKFCGSWKFVWKCRQCMRFRLLFRRSCHFSLPNFPVAQFSVAHFSGCRFFSRLFPFSLFRAIILCCSLSYHVNFRCPIFPLPNFSLPIFPLPLFHTLILCCRFPTLLFFVADFSRCPIFRLSFLPLPFFQLPFLPLPFLPFTVLNVSKTLERLSPVLTNCIRHTFVLVVLITGRHPDDWVIANWWYIQKVARISNPCSCFWSWSSRPATHCQLSADWNNKTLASCNFTS